MRCVNRVILTVAAVPVISGCATRSQPLYYWGNYQPEVFAHFKNQDDSEAQLARLDETVHKASSKGLPLPPGFNAHLGLLQLKAGHPDQARASFIAEETQFPESKSYVDFLLAKFNAPSKAGSQQ